MWRRFILFGLPLVVLFAVSSAASARLLHESARIALYSTRAEPGNRNSHPITLEADRLSAALSRLRVRSGETDEVIDLFPEKNRVEAAERMAEALSRIDADQDLHLVSFRHIGKLFAGQRKASAARVFVEGGRLNLIFGQIDLFYSEFRDPDRRVPPMGSRNQAASLKGRIIPTAGVSLVDGRNDWVALDLSPAPSSTSTAVPETPPAGQAQAEKLLNDSESREKNIEEKLQLLKTLRAKDLITEQEYAEKKRQILDGL
jgi:hypothetical protein